jgi:hypothetical protein
MDWCDSSYQVWKEASSAAFHRVHMGWIDIEKSKKVRVNSKKVPKNSLKIPKRNIPKKSKKFQNLLKITKNSKKFLLFDRELTHCAFQPDIGRIYIKGYLYPIYYPKIVKKDIYLSLFWAGYVEGYDILILGISKFYILSYPISFLWIFWREGYRI